MSNWTIEKSAVTGFLNELGKAYEVLAPSMRDDELVLEPLDSDKQVVLEFSICKQATKEIFFPRSEVLFSYQDGQAVPVPQADGQRVVFGIRPCDARSAVLLDNVFDAPDFQDPFYVDRRANTILIGLGCNKPSETCFCTAVGGNPFSTAGLDLLWTELGDRYLVETITERGEQLISGSTFLRQATPEDAATKAEIATSAEQMVSGPNTEGIKELLDERFESTFWDEVHRSCLGCGICTYLCPTCHCFDIVDERRDNHGQRVRNWDTCQWSLFTLHASGHNPRPTRKERMRQRVMHKFNYFVSNFGNIACVGCGRCVRECPVNLDIRAVIDGVRQVEVE